MRPQYGMTSAPLTLRLARMIRDRPVTGADLHQAALFTLDAVASAIAGRTTPPGESLRDWWRASGASPADPGRVAFLGGSLCHIREIDDLHRASVVHPGCVVVPAVLALAVSDESRSDGRRCLTAILHGFEAACRTGAAVGRAHYRVWHNTATCGPFGSALAAATLLDLPDDRTVHALGNAGTQAAGLWQFLDTGAMSKHLHAGRAAEAGVIAATLASRGFTGAPEILEGARGFFRAMCPDGDPSLVLAEPDAPWQLALTSIKPWPSCRHTHPAIDAAEEVRRACLEAGHDAAEAEAVSVETYQAALDLCDRPDPRSEYDAKFSLQHTVAAALASPAVWFDSFDPPARNRFAALRQRVRVFAADRFEQAYPRTWGATLCLEVGGRRFEAVRDAALGDPEMPLDETRLIDKACRLMALGGLNRPESLIDRVLAMAGGGPPPDLIALLSGLGAEPGAPALAATR